MSHDEASRHSNVKRVAPTGLTMIVADLPLGPGRTLYTWIGNVFPWTCVIFSFAIGAGAALRRHGARRPIELTL